MRSFILLDIYFTRYDYRKSMLLDKILVLDKIKMIIDIEKFEDTKILFDADNKLADEVTLMKNAVILITCVIKDDDKLFLQIFLEEALVA